MILYSILHTQKQHERVSNILETWGQSKNIIFYSDHEDPSYNIYKVSDNSEYSSGQEKQIKVLELLKNKFSHYDWYMFIDNDTFVNTNLIETNILKFDKSRLYGNIISMWAKNPFLPYPSGGAGFLMHRSLLEKFWLNELPEIENVPWSDVTIGLLCNFFGINYIHSSKFHMFEPWNDSYYYIRDKINFSEAKDQYTFHYIKDKDTMHKLYNACTNT